MADYKTSVDIVLEMQTKAMLNTFNKVNQGLKDMQNQYGKTMEAVSSYAKPFKELTLAAQHLDNLNMKKFQSNISQVTTEMSKMGAKMNSFGFKQFRSNIDLASDSVNRYNNAINRMSKLSTSSLDSIKNIDFSALDKINLQPVQKLASDLGHLDASNLKGVANAMQNISRAMNAMQNLNLDISLPKNVQSQMNTAAETLSNFVERISKFNLNGLKGFSRDIKTIPKAMQAMEKLDVSKIGQVFSTLATEVQPFLAHLKEASSELNALSNVLNKMGRRGGLSGLNSIKNEIAGVGKESDRTGRKLSNMLSAGKIYALYNQIRHFGGGFAKMLNQAVDFTEIENYFSRAMGNMRNEAMKFQNTLSDMYGLAMPSMMKAQATFKNQLSSLGGLTDDMSYMLSERLTKMALDFSSLYNTSIESAMTKFQAAISRQVRPIRSVSGYDITQNVLSATMKEIGINDRKIAQLNEMEKRLLIILTLQQQMARSAAMNDFARTINQPANQLKVLQQQIAEVGRWISAVFYGVIGQVLPYINGFVMAIKSLIQMFASFLGYELPDSSGQTGTILDGFEDSMGGVSDGIDDINAGLDGTNSGLDKATKKAKELAGALGIDELHTFGKNTDDSSGSGSGGSGSSGIGTIDPRILKALEDMDYLFDSIRMKAHEIRDQLLAWASILGNIVNENIFQPISNSWKKYGSSILGNITETRDNIVHILGGVFDVVAKKWKPFFSALSDLFFSLLDTVSLVSSTITKFLRHVWDAGGKYLFESIWDLATAFLKLATSINDNFVKPVIRWFKNSIAPVFGDLVGLVLKGAGLIVKAFANVIEWIANCKPVVILLSSAFTGLFIAIKVVKILELASALGGTHTVLKAFKMTIIDGNPIFQKMFSIFTSGKSVFESIKETWKASNIVLQNTTLFTKAKDAADKLAAISASIHARATDGLSLSQKICAATSGALATALNFLANHPMVIMVGAIAAVVGAIALFNSSQEESKYELEDYSQSIQDNIKMLQDMRGSLDKTAKAAKDAFDSKSADITAVKEYMDMLRDMAGETGFVDNVYKAEFLVGKINDLLPETVELTEDGRVKWLQNADAIQKNIDKLEHKARLEAYSQLYTEAIKNEIQARQTLADAESELNSLLEEHQEIQDRITKGTNKKGDFKRLEELNKNIAGTRETIEEANTTLEKSTKLVNSNFDSLKNESDETSKLSKSYSGLSDARSESFNALGRDLITVNKQLKDHADGTIKLNDKQVKSAKEAKEALLRSYTERATAFGMSYEQMLKVLKQQGIEIGKEEEKQLKESFDDMKDSNAAKQAEFKRHSDALLENIKSSHQGIQEEDQKSYTKMLELFSTYGIKIDSKNSALYEKIFDICKKSNKDITTEEGKQYALMLQMLQQNGVDLTVEKKDQYKKLYNAFVQHGTGMSEEQKNQYSRFLSELAKAGIEIDSEQGKQYLKEYLAAQKAGTENGDEYISEFKDKVGKKNINKETSDVLRKAKKVASENPLSVLINMPDGRDLGGKLMSALQTGMQGTPFELPIKALGAVGKVLGPFGSIKIGGWYANGGFPDLGQMFIAREAGPELVGTMKGRTAVANNNQIIAGIEGGVARGMAAALERTKDGNTSSEKVVIENHIHVEVDGREVAEAVDEVKLKDGYDFGMGRK